MPKIKDRVAVGFYTDDDGEVKPITKSTTEHNRKKIIKNPKEFKGVSPKNNTFKNKLADYYGQSLSKVKLVLFDDEAEWKKRNKEILGGRRWKGVIAWGSPVKNEVLISPTLTKGLSGLNHIDSVQEFHSAVVLAHEFGHAVDTTHPWSTGEAFDEGLTELLALKFVLSNIPMSHEVKKEVLQKRLWTYNDEMKFVWRIALRMNANNPKAAFNWLKRFKTDSDKRVFMGWKNEYGERWKEYMSTPRKLVKDTKEKLKQESPRLAKQFEKLDAYKPAIKKANSSMDKKMPPAQSLEVFLS